MTELSDCWFKAEVMESNRWREECKDPIQTFSKAIEE